MAVRSSALVRGNPVVINKSIVLRWIRMEHNTHEHQSLLSGNLIQSAVRNIKNPADMVPESAALSGVVKVQKIRRVNKSLHIAKFYKAVANALHQFVIRRGFHKGVKSPNR
jgi:hypothetical protein